MPDSDDPWLIFVGGNPPEEKQNMVYTGRRRMLSTEEAREAFGVSGQYQDCGLYRSESRSEPDKIYCSYRPGRVGPPPRQPVERSEHVPGWWALIAAIGRLALGAALAGIIVSGFVDLARRSPQPQYGEPGYLSPEAGAALLVMFLVGLGILVLAVADVVDWWRKRRS